MLAAADLAHQADDHAGVDAVYEGEIGAEISLAFLRVSRGRGVELVEEEAVAGDEGGLVFWRPVRWGGKGEVGTAVGTGEEALHFGEGFDLLLGSEGKLCYSGVTLPEIRCK